MARARERVTHSAARPWERTGDRDRPIGVRCTLASVLVAALAAWSLTSCDPGDDGTTPQSAPRSGALPTTVAESCARSYDEPGLRAQAFAVDATVDSVRRHGRRVDLHVTEWFRGGSANSGDSLTLDGLGDPASERASELGVPYAVGTRLLVSGQYAADGSLVVWHCGYTRYWSRGDDAAWRDAFGSTAPPLPDGLVAVPYVPFGASDREIVGLLRAAGLEADVPDVDWPHYVIGVDPPAGTVVPLGSKVQVQIGDG